MFRGECHHRLPHINIKELLMMLVVSFPDLNKHIKTNKHSRLLRAFQNLVSQNCHQLSHTGKVHLHDNVFFLKMTQNHPDAQIQITLCLSDAGPVAIQTIHLARSVSTGDFHTRSRLFSRLSEMLRKVRGEGTGLNDPSINPPGNNK